MIKIKLGGIYMISHSSGYYYIGKSVDIFGRWGSHYTQLKMGTHSSVDLQKLWGETRPEEWEFKILETVSKTELKKRSGMKGKQFETHYNRILLDLEKTHMRNYSKNFALNKNNTHFS